jgi:hypothetical protein
MEKIVIVKWKLKESEASRILKMLPEARSFTKSRLGKQTAFLTGISSLAKIPLLPKALPRK